MGKKGNSKTRDQTRDRSDVWPQLWKDQDQSHHRATPATCSRREKQQQVKESVLNVEAQTTRVRSVLILQSSCAFHANERGPRRAIVPCSKKSRGQLLLCKWLLLNAWASSSQQLPRRRSSINFLINMKAIYSVLTTHSGCLFSENSLVVEITEPLDLGSESAYFLPRPIP